MDTEAGGRLLPQHFNRDGSTKRKYDSLAEAVYAAGNLPSNDPDRPMQAYPCYCEAFHVGQARPGQLATDVHDLEALRGVLTRMGYRRGDDYVPLDGDAIERWEPVDGSFGATSLPLLWKGLYRRAEVDARQLRAERHAVPVEAREYAADEKRLLLVNAGWRRVDNPDRERWLPPGKNRKRLSSAQIPDLDQAFEMYRHQAAARPPVR